MLGELKKRTMATLGKKGAVRQSSLQLGLGGFLQS